MYLKLTQEWIEDLKSLPESGMGYQLVDITLEGGQRLSGVPVFNAEDIYVPESRAFEVSKIRNVRLHDAEGGR